MAKPKKRKWTKQPMGLDGRLAQALNHPTRTEIIAILSDRNASASEIAKVLDQELSGVAYHCKQLLRFDCIEVVSKEQVRGAVKTKYRASVRMLIDTPDWSKLGKGTRQGISLNAINEVIGRASDAIEAGTFDERTDRILLTFKPRLDEAGWSRSVEILREAWTKIEALEEETAGRFATDPDLPSFQATISLLGYQSP